MIDYKALAKQHGPTVGIAALVAVIAVLVTRPHASTSTPSSPIVKPEAEPAPTLRRCTGVDGTQTSGTVSVHDHGIHGCFVAFRQSFDHDPTCSVEVIGAIDTDHHFDKGALKDVSATRDRLVMPSAQERMLLHYTCK